MNGLFSYEGVLTQTLIKLGKCMCLGMLWVVTSLPILTIGAANSAVAYTVRKVREDQDGVCKLYWKSFKANFAQATISWATVSVLFSLLIYSCYCSYVMFLSDIIGVAVPLVVSILVLIAYMWAQYVFPYIAFFANDTMTILKNCFVIAILNIHWSILLVLIALASVLCSILIPMGFLVMPALGMLIKSYALDKVFQKYQLTPEEIENDYSE